VSNIIVDGFATYGIGVNSSAVNAALLAGVYSDINASQVSVGQGLPWNTSDTEWWLACTQTFSGGAYAVRRSMPTAISRAFFSMHVAVNALPTSNDQKGVIDFRNASNQIMGQLFIESTGALSFNFGNGSADSSGPVIGAETDYHLEMDIDTASKNFTLQVNGVTVITSTAAAWLHTGNLAQFALSLNSSAGGNSNVYVGSLIVRDTNGSYNNSFPIGDRRVATLLPDVDDAAQGWAVQPLHRFGPGVLALTGSLDGVLGAASAASDLGSGDFTIEGSFRFAALPLAGNKAVLFGKWGETANQRAYQLYLGGPSLENGWLVFRTSTDGTSGTVVEKIQWAWQPTVGQWYHIAVSRNAGNLQLFIDGVQVGLTVTDTDTYHATALERPVLGIQVNGITAVANTFLDGWNDEFRMTVGAARYTANFAPPTDKFPRNGDDPLWADVIWLSGWDSPSISNDTGGFALTGIGTANALTPSDGSYGWQVIDKSAPNDTTFIEASLIPATGLLTLTAVPANTETVTVGTKDGTAAAVYTFKTAIASAFDVLIGASISASVDNLVAAINGGVGAGVTYGTGTTANFDVTAAKQPSSQMQVTANTPGTGGNSIASTETLANGSWASATLTGGLNIPGYSQFGFSHLPRGAVIVDSVTLLSRQWKSDAGATTTTLSFVGGEGGVAAGATRAISGTPTAYFDTIEEDPDTTAGLTPNSILNGLVRVNRAT
jgi:hypothetical protein